MTNPQSASLEKYSAASSALRAFASGNEPLDKYVVGTVGSTDPCLTPQGETSLAVDLHFSGRTFEDLQHRRGEILATTKEDLKKFADVLDRMDKQSSICVVGGTAGVSSCSNVLDKVESITALP